MTTDREWYNSYDGPKALSADVDPRTETVTTTCFIGWNERRGSGVRGRQLTAEGRTTDEAIANCRLLFETRNGAKH